MDVLTDEYRMLQDTLDGILAETPASADIWPQLAELGMLGLTLPEETGGAGLGMTELILFSGRLGRACVSTPFLGAEVMAMPILGALSAHPAIDPVLPDLLNGSRIVTVALDDRAEVTAEQEPGGGFVLNGTKMLVPAGGRADLVIVSASMNGSAALFLTEVASTGVRRAPYSPATAGGDADLRFSDVPLSNQALLVRGGDAARMIGDARSRAQLYTCAEMLGGMEVLLEQTVDYLRTRQQFGRPLAAFQALQHAAVDMYVELETARSMLHYGSRMILAAPTQRAIALDALKLKMNAAAKLIGETAVQLHGGFGMTQESMTGRQFARLTAARLAFGESRACMNRLLASNVSIALS